MQGTYKESGYLSPTIDLKEFKFYNEECAKVWKFAKSHPDTTAPKLAEMLGITEDKFWMLYFQALGRVD